jgi:hypothetical protein
LRVLVHKRVLVLLVVRFIGLLQAVVVQFEALAQVRLGVVEEVVWAELNQVLFAHIVGLPPRRAVWILGLRDFVAAERRWQ